MKTEFHALRCDYLICLFFLVITGIGITFPTDCLAAVADLTTSSWQILGQDTLAYGIDGSNVVGVGPMGNSLYNINTKTWTSMPYLSGSLKGISGDNIITEHQVYNMTSKTLTNLNYHGEGSTRIRGIDGSNIVGFYNEPTINFIYNMQSKVYTMLNLQGFVQSVSGSNIAGFYGDSSGEHGFIYNLSTQSYTTLNYPGAISSTRAYGISGNIVAGKYDGNCFFYNILTQTYTSFNYPGATWITVEGISGNNIVGELMDGSTHYHGYIYTIPEPGTL